MLSVESLISEMALMRLSDPASFLGAFADALKKSTGADISQFKDLKNNGSKPTQGEEFILNTGMPYLDNSLSSYSAFPELINYFNSGFKSCIIMPLKTGGNSVGMITLLSRKDRFFQEGDLRRIGLLGSLAAREYWLMDKAGSEALLAEYFDAVFNGIMPQCIIDAQGTVLLANKAFGGLSGADARRSTLQKLLGLDRGTVENLKNGVPAEILIPQGRKFRLYPQKAGGSAIGITLYDVTEPELMKEREQFFRYGSEACMLLSKDTGIKWVSDNVKDALRIEPDYLPGKRLSNVVKDREYLEALQ